MACLVASYQLALLPTPSEASATEVAGWPLVAMPLAVAQAVATADPQIGMVAWFLQPLLTLVSPQHPAETFQLSVSPVP